MLHKRKVTIISGNSLDSNPLEKLVLVIKLGRAYSIPHLGDFFKPLHRQRNGCPLSYQIMKNIAKKKSFIKTELLIPYKIYEAAQWPAKSCPVERHMENIHRYHAWRGIQQKPLPLQVDHFRLNQDQFNYVNSGGGRDYFNSPSSPRPTPYLATTKVMSV